jgi:hypothetical protein
MSSSEPMNDRNSEQKQQQQEDSSTTSTNTTTALDVIPNGLHLRMIKTPIHQRFEELKQNKGGQWLGNTGGTFGGMARERVLAAAEC